MKTFLRQVWSGSWMLFWSAMLAWAAYGVWHGCWWVAARYEPLLGLFIVVLAVIPLISALHGTWLALLILTGRSSPRMARRRFRNGLADVVMYAKTGLWKE